MAQIKPQDVVQTDIEDYFDNYSDFGFEIKVKKLLDRAIGPGKYVHGGTYSDPVSGLKRQFDFRVKIEQFQTLFINLAIECKNLKPNFPLVVHAYPRPSVDSYHETMILEQGQFRTVRSSLNHSRYRREEGVGKSVVQLGLSERPTPKYVTNDTESYQKWSQAIQHLEALIDYEDQFKSNCRSAYIPILVVPDDCLWLVQCDKEGNRSGFSKVDQCALFLGAKLRCPNRKIDFNLSHLEFVTLTGLTKYFRWLASATDYPDETFFADVGHG